MITYMTEPVNVECLLKAHKTTIFKLNSFINTAEEGLFMIDDNEYRVIADHIKQKKRSSYTISKGDKEFPGLAPKEVSFYVGRGVSVVSNKTIKTGSAMINGWLVEREEFEGDDE